MKKIVIFFTALVSFATWSMVTTSSVEEVVRFAQANSYFIQELKEQFQSQKWLEGNKLKQFDWKLTANLGHTQGENPPTNASLPAEKEINSFDLMLEKKLKSGVVPFFTKKVADNAYKYTSRSDSLYKSSSLNVGFRWDLLKDLIRSNAKNTHLSVAKKRKILDLTLRLQELNFLQMIGKQSLGLIYQFKLHQFFIQKCRLFDEVQKLTKSRYRKNLLEEKDYLLSLTRFLQCKIERDRLERGLSNQRSKLRSLISGTTSGPSLTMIGASWPANSTQTKKFAILDLQNSHLEFALAKENLNLDLLNENIANANFSSNLNFIAMAQALGENGDFSTAISDTYSVKYPSYSVSLQYKIPFGEDDSKNSARKAAFTKRLSQEYKLKRIAIKLQNDISDLYSQMDLLNKEIHFQNKVIATEKRKYSLFFKDFQRGRVNLKDLIDNQNSLIQAEISLLRLNYDLRLLFNQYLYFQNRTFGI